MAVRTHHLCRDAPWRVSTMVPNVLIDVSIAISDEVDPLVQGLEPIVSHPSQVIAEVLEWTGGQPFLTQKLCKLIVQESDSDTFKSANGIEALVRENIIENWEACDEPEHLRTIRDRMKWSQRRKPLLLLYQQILHQGKVKAKDTPEQMELRLSGLVVKQQGKLRVTNRILREVFNPTWLDELLAEADILSQKLAVKLAIKTNLFCKC
ncbi:MAG: hypothetical protein RIG63_09765 [Coleofasciculus chthonoplastes F3-SA18-01]|uniref:hypothetical protein n=1 Tax=Coleofasciculus chthonoplastes TaxID=64178 RepID=UPI0032F9AB6E